MTTNKEKLVLWGNKVALNKKDLDKTMFRDLLGNVLSYIDREGWDSAFRYVASNIKMIDSNMVGPRLLGINSQMIHKKMWSIKKKEAKV